MTGLTNGLDLQAILTHCLTCAKAVDYGRRIICHSWLPLFNIKTYSFQSPIAFICNSSCDFKVIGHWVTILVMKSKSVILCDGLNYVINDSAFMQNVRKFCILNDLKFVNLGIRSQSLNSFHCGFIAIFWVSKFAELSPSKFQCMIRLLRRNSIQSNEKFMLKYVKRHFKVWMFLFISLIFSMIAMDIERRADISEASNTRKNTVFAFILVAAVIIFSLTIYNTTISVHYTVRVSQLINLLFF